MTSPHLCKLRARTAAVAALSALLLGASGSASAQPALSEWTAGVLEERGFVVVPGEFTDFASAYEGLNDAGFPPYVTVDAALYSTASVLDATLAALEEGDLYDRLAWLSMEIGRLSEEQYLLASDPLVKEAARLNMAYFAVGLSLLDGDYFPPETVRGLVERELALIEEGAGVATSPVMGRTPLDDVAGPGEDYSNYCPRGRCASGERLSRFHRAVTWYGRMAFALPEGRLADYELTRQALLLVRAMESESEEWLELWERVQEPLAFFYGDSGDPTVVDYADVSHDVFGEGFDIELLADAELLSEFALRVSETAPTHFGTHELRGMRFLVRRFPPDTPYLYSLSLSDLRSLPTTLDVMALLDSRAARSVLADDRMAFDAEVYRTTFERIEYALDGLTYGDWTRDLYWSWMYALRPLLSAPGGGAPDRTRGDSWDAKQLSTALAAWALMRNEWDESEPAGAGERLTSAESLCLVDPYPELYLRLSELIDHASDRLLEHYLLRDDIAEALDDQRATLSRLESAARAQLEGGETAPGVVDGSFGCAPLDAVLGAIPRGRAVAFAATAYENPTSGNLLEVAVGRPDIMYVRQGAGNAARIFAGAVFSFYEFEREDTLADEAPYRPGRPVTDGAARPAWTSRFLLE